MCDNREELWGEEQTERRGGQRNLKVEARWTQGVTALTYPLVIVIPGEVVLGAVIITDFPVDATCVTQRGPVLHGRAPSNSTNVDGPCVMNMSFFPRMVKMSEDELVSSWALVSWRRLPVYDHL